MVQEQRLQLKMKFLLGENCCLVGGAPIFIFCLKTILKVLESKPLRYCEILFSCNKSLTFRNLIDRILELCIIFQDQKFEPPSHFPSQLFLNGEGIYILWEGKKKGEWSFLSIILLKLGSTPCKAVATTKHGITRKRSKKVWNIQEICFEKPYS